jgi:hypothetical protein
VPPSAQRGGHAHRRLEQVMFAVGASMSNEPAHAASSPDVCDAFFTEACSIASPIYAEPRDGSVS